MHAARTGLHHQFIGVVREIIEAERGAEELADSASSQQPVEITTPAVTHVPRISRDGKDHSRDAAARERHVVARKIDAPTDAELDERDAQIHRLAEHNRELARKRNERYAALAWKEVVERYFKLSAADQRKVRAEIDRREAGDFLKVRPPERAL
jgi:hypothetical protein